MSSPPPATQPFQAPDFGEDDDFWPDDAQPFAPETGTASRG
ncbi:hypothetical protein [Streptomyces abyssomicinicus]|nr:hypothetical protein [Streptomyces abyssomicinicus]